MVRTQPIRSAHRSPFCWLCGASHCFRLPFLFPAPLLLRSDVVRRWSKLRLIFYLNILAVALLLVYKVYLNFFEEDFESVHARQVERIEAKLSGRSSFTFAVVGNINNSVGIFDRKIIPMINGRGVDFAVSAGNAVSSGGEDKYRAIYRTLSQLQMPYLLTFGENEDSRLGGFRFYDHFGPYLFAFSAGNSRFVFLDSTGKTSWEWQLRWLEEELAVTSSEHTFLFSGRPVRPIDRKGVLDFGDDYLLPEEVSDRFTAIIERFRVDAVFSANVPLFSRVRNKDTEYVVTGGAGGLVLNNERSYYHYVEVAVQGDRVDVAPIRLDIGQHPVFRTLESLWFFVHSVFYVGYLNFLLLVSVLIAIAIWLYVAVFTERNYYPNFDLEPEPFLRRPLRVAMFTNSFLPFVGGVPISIDRLRRGLKTLGHQVLIAAPSYDAKPENKEEEDTLRLPALIRLGEKGEFPIPNIFSLPIYRAVAAFRPDVIHLHHPFWLGRAGLFLARRLKVPVVYTYHTRLEHFAHYMPLARTLFRNLISHAQVRRFANRCDGVVVPTESAEEYLRMIGVKSPIFVQPTGVDPQCFLHVDNGELDKLRARLGIGDERILISVSRLSKEKNIDFMLDAIHDLAKSCHLPFKLLIVGEGTERDHLRERIRQLGLEKQVFLLGAVPPEEVPAYCRLADIFVFASRAETQGMVILEAMAAGLPVVAVRSSGINDFIQNGFNGYTTKLNAGLWGEHIEKLLADSALRERLAANAREFAKVYSIEKFGYEMTQVYARVLAAKVTSALN
ncbi:MAG: glycosyltransferase [Deltaproteobacteria bacterium]|nr:glycosyltransferase [Deltaproteobacteria bacterium]